MSTSTQQVFSAAVSAALRCHPRLTTLSDLAKATGYHRNSISQAVKHGRYPRVRKEIRRVLNLKVKL